MLGNNKQENHMRTRNKVYYGNALIALGLAGTGYGLYNLPPEKDGATFSERNYEERREIYTGVGFIVGGLITTMIGLGFCTKWREDIEKNKPVTLTDEEEREGFSNLLNDLDRKRNLEGQIIDLQETSHNERYDFDDHEHDCCGHEH
ncbi:hypothetical protein COU57_06670 [Candidatus Pacearchaeota archaeon CG10_big_fil_rev_8_21_14_0_10_32_14]|nr:MAG: hypothetical protein COU57_06670 [Candidatus Pacearchaeota archaeon CG10_big_fil_rev_8_21_14_0_10_32_14]